MALTLSISLATSDCKNLVFTETTGVYSAGNLTGWGTPNTLITAATAATVVITTPSGSSYTFPLFTSGFPSINPLASYSIPSSSLGLGTALADGIYTAVYTVSNTLGEAPFLFTATVKTMVICNLECCIDSLLSQIDSCGCDCDSEAQEKYLDAFSLFRQLEHSIKCTDFKTAECLLALANKICKNSNCTSCE